MKGGYKFGIGLLIVVILVIALIQAAQKKPINWSRTYNPKDKIPFGTYVIRHELKHIFPRNKSLRAVNQSLFTFLSDSLKQTKEPKDIFFVGGAFNPGKAALNKLLNFVHQGNNVLIAADNLSKKMKDTLNLNIRQFNSYLAKVAEEPDSLYYTLPAFKLSARYPKNDGGMFFDDLDSSTTTIIGYLKRRNIKLPNFVKIHFGNGLIFCQLTPEVYSNYFMLNAKTYPIAYQSLHHLSGEHLIWCSPWGGIQTVRTPLRFILSRPPLRAAWYLLLVTLILYLIFKGKREQKAVPIVEPEKNMSVAFAETIGALYYESGTPGNMVMKKINYFLYDLKKKYRFDDIVIHDANFRKQAAKRLHLSREDIDDFFDRLIHYQKLQQPTLNDLKSVQKIIEDFKQNIHLT